MIRRTKEEAMATRSALLDAAERVFQQKGVTRTSLADIAQAAGMTRGAIYWHFENKAALFTAMVERVTQPLHASLVAAADAADDADDAVVLLNDRIRQGLHQIEHDAQTRRVLEICLLMVEHVDELGALRSLHAQGVRTDTASIARVLTRAARQRNATLIAPVQTLAQGLNALIHGVVHHWLLDPTFSLGSTARQVVGAYLLGIGLPCPCTDDER